MKFGSKFPDSPRWRRECAGKEKKMDVQTLLQNHKSIRKFKAEPVDEQLVRELIRCGQHAATSEFIQSYTVIRIADETLRDTIYQEVANQKTILGAPVFLIFCVDVNRLIMACQMNDRTAPDSYMEATETFLMASVDTAIAAQNVVVAAEAEGLGCTYIGGIRNNLKKLIELLKLPKGVYPIFGLVMGYPAENTDEMAKPRLPLDVVYKENQYQTEGDEPLIRQYDEVIRKYYVDRTGGERNETWTEQMSDFVAKPQRPFLKEVIQGQGFALK